MKQVQTFDEALADLVDDYRSTPRNELIVFLEMQILALQEEREDEK